VAYVAKYASKGQAESGASFPAGARVHGIGGLLKQEARVVAWWKLPKSLRRGVEGSEVWRRAPGGGWVCRDGESAGEFIPPSWGLSAVDTEHKRVRLVVKSPAVPGHEEDREFGMLKARYAAAQWYDDRTAELRAFEFVTQTYDPIAWLVGSTDAGGQYRYCEFSGSEAVQALGS
jgi:hypothetical protein